MYTKEFAGDRQTEDAALMWEYLNQEDFDYQQPEYAEIRTGIVLRKDENEIVLDLGLKRDAVVTSRDLDKLEPDEIESIGIHDEIAVFILNPQDEDNRIVASINMAKSQEDWDRAETWVESGEIFEAVVTGYNKGGLIVDFGRLRGFIPASQVWNLVQRSESGSRLERLAQLVGEDIQLKVIEVNQKRRRLILSERAAMRELRAESKKRLLEELAENDVRTGVVTNLLNFGAFVDIGGADGLVHVSELAWHRVKHPKDVLEVGEEVEVYVLDVDRERERIALSIKRLQPDPWSQVSEKYTVGDVVEAEITNLTDFGAFARVEPAIEGLIHISELSHEHIDHPRELVHRGQLVTLKIISIDTMRQRMGLSLKRAPATIEPVAEEPFEPGEASEGVAESEAAQPAAQEPETTEAESATPEMAAPAPAEEPEVVKEPRRDPAAPAATSIEAALADALGIDAS